MFGLLFFLLLTAGTFLAFRFSSASTVKKRMLEALSPFLKELDAELHCRDKAFRMESNCRRANIFKEF